MQHGYMTWNERGRDAFATYQMHRFDEYMATPRPFILTILNALIGCIFIFGLYELIAAFFSRVFPSTGTASQASIPPNNSTHTPA